MISVVTPKGEPQQTRFSEGWNVLLDNIPESVEDICCDIFPDDQPEFELCWQKALRGKLHQQFEFRLRVQADYKWLLGDLAPIQDDFFSGVIATFIDITDRKAAELRQSAEYELIDLVINSLHAFVAYVDCDEKYKYVNRAYSEFLGKEKSDFLGMTVQEVLGIAYDRVVPYIQEAFQGKKVQYEINVLGQGELHRCGVTLVPHFGESGVVSGIFVLAEEIGQTDVAHSHFEDLERFMGHWQANPKEMCHFMGRAIARLGYRNLHDFFFAAGAAYFSFREICDRIDFIYDHRDDEVKGEKGKLLKELIEITEERKIIQLKDKAFKRHGGVRVMLLRDTVDGYPTYSLRYFLGRGERLRGYLKDHWDSSVCSRPTFDVVLNPLDADSSDQQYEDDFTFWNFRRPTDLMHGVVVYPDARGFDDLHETKNLGDFIVLASNLLGYSTCVKENGPLLA